MMFRLISARTVCAVIAWLSLSAGAGAWSTEQQLTTVGGASGQPAIGIDGNGRLHVIYASPIGGTLQFQYQYRLGAGWSTAQDLPGPVYKQADVDLAIDAGNTLHVVGIYRVDGTVNTPYSVYYWSYNGTSWSGPTLLSSGTGDDGDGCGSPRVRVDRFGDLHAVWSQNGRTGGSGDILYRKRVGGVWQATQNITNNGTCIAYGSVEPDLAIDAGGDTLHLVWHDDNSCDGFRVHYTKNTSLGAANAWLPSNQWTTLSYSNPGGADYGKGPRIFLDASNRPNVFWTDRFGSSSNNVLAFSRWTGGSWTAPVSWGSMGLQAVRFDAAGFMHILYTSAATGTTELYYRQYNYLAFSDPELVSAGSDTLKVDFANMALDQFGVPQAVWEERKGAWPGTGYVFYSGRSTYTGPTGTLSGFVRDQNNLAIPGATVAGPSSFSTLTAANGSYSLMLPVGTHSVTAAKTYYGSQTISNVTITTNQTTNLDFTITASAPNPITNFVVVPGNTSNHLAWTSSNSASATGTMVRFSTDGPVIGPDDGTLLADVSGGGNRTLQHTGLINGLTYHYAAFAHDGDAHHSVGIAASGTPALPCDFDRDGDVDQGDFGRFQACLTGPGGVQAAPECTGALLDAIDYDVDSADLAMFLGCFSGPDVYANPTCLN